jgi:aryl-alcohol dehydrogenase-like predicted oxidoreductase
VPIEDTLGALDELVKEGKVREIGCSNFSAAQLREADTKARGAKFVSVQNQFSLLHTDGVPEVLEECERLGIAFIPYFPLASGLLSGKYRKGQPVPTGTRIVEGSEALLKLAAVEGLISYAESQGHTILDLAVSWLLAFPKVASVIAGATKEDQVRANARACNWELTLEQQKSVEHALVRAYA